MSRSTARSLAIAGALASVPLQCLLAQSGELVSRVARAVALLDSAQTERGADALRALLAQWPQGGPTDLRVRAHLHLGAASLALGLRDSALIHFAEGVRLNAFAVPDPEVFNPDILAAFREVRRSTPVLHLRVSADTVIRPLVEGYLVAVAVGRPGPVNLQVVRVDGAAISLISFAVSVDSTSSSVIPLRLSDSLPWDPGEYRLTAEMPGTGTPPVLVRLRITRPPFDTTALEPALDSTLFRAEMRKGPPVPASALAGFAFGAAAVAVPMLLGNKDLGGGKAEIPAISVGVGVSVAGIAGVVLGRRMVPIQENVQYNRSLVAAWEQRNGAIAMANEAKRRVAPLRVTVVEEPR